MNKIKDRFALSLLAGGIGGSLGMGVDVISSFFKISKRSWPVTAAGVLVSTPREANSPLGKLLGSLMTITLSIVGSFGLISLITKYGRDNVIAKGLVFGMAYGFLINSLLGTVAENKLRPKDALSNLSYVLSSAFFGVATAITAAKIGHDSLYDAPPTNNWVRPIERTTEELRLEKANAAK